MPRVASFEFFEDPVAKTGMSVCTINWTAETIAYPGVTGVGFAQCDELITVLNDLSAQSEADNIVDVTKTITGGATNLIVTYNLAATPRTISPGGTAFGLAKCQDLAAGIQQYVIAELP